MNDIWITNRRVYRAANPYFFNCTLSGESNVFGRVINKVDEKSVCDTGPIVRKEFDILYSKRLSRRAHIAFFILSNQKLFKWRKKMIPGR